MIPHVNQCYCIYSLRFVMTSVENRWNEPDF